MGEHVEVTAIPMKERKAAVMIYFNASQTAELCRRHQRARKWKDPTGRQPYKDMTFEQFLLDLLDKDRIMEEARTRWPGRFDK